MALARFVRNVSGSAIRIASAPVGVNAFYEIPFFSYAEFASNPDVKDAVTNDQLLLSFDGVTTLTKANSLLALETFAESQQIFFDRGTSNFGTSILNVRDALINLREGLDSGVSGLFEATKTSAQNITSTVTTTVFNNEKTNTDATLFDFDDTTGIMTFDRSADIFVIAKVCADVNSNSRSGSRAFIEFNNQGGGFQFVDGSEGFGYHRQNNTGVDNPFCTTTLAVQAGDQLRIRMESYVGDTSFPLTLSGCSLIIKESEARGPRGLQGVPAFQYLFGGGVPSNGLGDDGDIYTDNSTGDQYRKDAGVWTFQLNIKGPPGVRELYIWAEENGTLSNNNTQWSFGNGSVGNIGIPMIKAGRIIGMSFNAENAPSSTCTVEILVNGGSSGLSITTGSGVNDNFVVFPTPVNVNAGDRIGFRTVLGGSANDCRACALIEHT